MPHDNRGTELHEGDVVFIECIVKQVHEGDEFCNVDLETKFAMPPSGTTNLITLNTKQVIKK